MTQVPDNHWQEIPPIKIATPEYLDPYSEAMDRRWKEKPLAQQDQVELLKSQSPKNTIDELPRTEKAQVSGAYRQILEQFKRETEKLINTWWPSDPGYKEFKDSLPEQFKSNAKAIWKEYKRQMNEVPNTEEGQISDADSFRNRIALRINAAFAWVRSNPSRFVLGAGCLLMTLALLFPPFQKAIPFYRGDVVHQHAGFHFLFAPPLDRLAVNIGLLGLELLVIGFITVTAYFVFKDK